MDTGGSRGKRLRALTIKNAPDLLVVLLSVKHQFGHLLTFTLKLLLRVLTLLLLLIDPLV